MKASNSRLLVAKITRSVRAFQDERRACPMRAHRTRRLHVQNRSKGHVHSGTYSPAISKIPDIQLPCKHQTSHHQSFRVHGYAHHRLAHRKRFQGKGAERLLRPGRVSLILGSGMLRSGNMLPVKSPKVAVTST